ncbi:hypothetical protein STEG23_031431, partial [Scotinomys teguina]
MNGNWYHRTSRGRGESAPASEEGTGKMCVVEHTCDLHTQEVEAGGSDVQDHPWGYAMA